jgi:hypothetical protein
MRRGEDALPERLIVRRLIAVLALLSIGGCASLPAGYERVASHALDDTASTVLGRSTGELLKAHPGQSGFRPLPNGVDALVVRMILAELAERSLDVQYYIWRGDLTGGCSRTRCFAPPTAACGCAFSSTTSAPGRTTTCCWLSIRIATSRSACSTRSLRAPFAVWACSPTSRASIDECTTRPSSPTTSGPYSAVATSATSTSMPMAAWSSAIST